MSPARPAKPFHDFAGCFPATSYAIATRSTSYFSDFREAQHNYYRNGAAKRTFEKVDTHVFQRLWRWATRRHPHKSRRWTKRKYFSASGENWRFSVSTQSAKGESRVLKLYRLASTQIQRHIKVKGTAHPYDPRYTEYFEQRRCFAWRVLWGNQRVIPISTP